MFKIDKSSVEFLDANRFLTVVSPASQEETDPAPKNSASSGGDASTARQQASAPLRSEKPDASFQDRTEHTSGHNDAITMMEESPEQFLISAAKAAEGILSDAAAQAAKLLEDAKYDSFCISAEAAKNAEQVRIEAWQKGYSEGLAYANEQAEQHRREFEALMGSIVSQTEQFIKNVNAAFEENVLRLSFAIAKKIINIELKNNDIVFEQLIKRTLQLHHEESRVFLRVSPSAYERYFQNGSDWLKSSMETAPFKVIADASLPKYGLLLETEDGSFKTGPDVQLDILKEALGVKGSADEAVL